MNKNVCSRKKKKKLIQISPILFLMDGASYQLHVKKIRALTRLEKLLWTITNNMEKILQYQVSDFYFYIKFLMKNFYDQYGGDLKYTNIGFEFIFIYRLQNRTNIVDYFCRQHHAVMCEKQLNSWKSSVGVIQFPD